jgi:hypothetical protein
VSFRRLTILIAGIALLAQVLRAAKGEPYPGLGRKWHYYQSPNFELYSANGDRDSREVLEKMELLRALFLDTFQLKPRLPQPVTLYFFAKQEEFDAYLPASVRGGTAKYAGYCYNYPDRTVITLAPTRDRRATREVVYHEYIHHLFRITEQNPAPWFNEGMAELFSTMEEDKEWLVLGLPVVRRVLELQHSRMMPFDQLFAVRYESPVFRESGHSGIFYAQSWAFLHYCRFGVNKIPADKMAIFLRVAGSPDIQERSEEFRSACRELLGMNYQELLREMERYVTSGRFQGGKAKRPVIADRQTYQMRDVAPEEIAVRLAEVSLRFTGSPTANLYVRGRLEQAPDARLHELMGSVASQADETDGAREHWRQAVELGTTNVAIFRELARLEANLVFGQFNLDYRMPEKRATDLRHLLQKSIECAPTQSAGYEMLAWVEASVAKPDIANVNLVQQHFKTLNDKPRTLLALVLVRYHLGETKEALELLDQLGKFDLNPWSAYGAEVTRARIEDRPVNQAKLPANTPSRMIMKLPAFEPPR